MGFVKLDQKMLQSTTWDDVPVRNVFITALLMAKPFELLGPMAQLKVRSLEETGWVVPSGWYGFAEVAGVGLLKAAGWNNEEGYAALETLGNPDPESRSQDHEGRRLVRISGGYIVLNFFRFREKDYTSKDRSRRYRERKFAIEKEASHRDDPSRHASRRTEAEGQKHTTTPLPPSEEGGAAVTKTRKKKSPLPDDPAFEAIWKLHNDYCKELSTRGIRASSGKKTEAKVEWFKVPADKRNRIHAILADQIEADAFNYGSLGHRVQNLSNYLKSGKWDAAVPEKIEAAPERPNEAFRVAVESFVYTSDHARGWVCGRMGWDQFGIEEDEAWIAMPYEKKVELYKAYEKRYESDSDPVLF